VQAREKLLREDARRADLDPVFDGFASCASDLVDGHHAIDVRTAARGPQVENEIVGVAHVLFTFRTLMSAPARDKTPMTLQRLATVATLPSLDAVAESPVTLGTTVAE